MSPLPDGGREHPGHVEGQAGPPTPAPIEPRGPQALADALREADAAGRAVIAIGTGTRPPVAAQGPGRGARSGPALRLATTGCAELVAHEPGEQTVTAQAGLRLATLAAHLARHGQWLPGAGTEGTLGGWLAASPDAASDRSCGRPRDRLLGCQAALADGTLARGRGRVVKNVAGYDLPRLLAGSLGTLAILTEATLKVEPLPAARVLLRARFDATAPALRALLALHVSSLEPATLDLRAVHDERRTSCELLVGIVGGPTGVAARAAEALRELDRHGARDVVQLDGPDADRLRQALDAPRGPVLVRAPAPPSRRRGPAPPDLALMLRIKQALDPRGTLAPALGLAGWPVVGIGRSP